MCRELSPFFKEYVRGVVLVVFRKEMFWLVGEATIVEAEASAG